MSKYQQVPDKDRVVKTNARIDLVQVEEALRMMRELRALGHRSAAFSLAPPHSRERPQPADKAHARSNPRQRAW